MDVHPECLLHPTRPQRTRGDGDAKLEEKRKLMAKSSQAIWTVSCSMHHYKLVFHRKKVLGNRNGSDTCREGQYHGHPTASSLEEVIVSLRRVVGFSFRKENRKFKHGGAVICMRVQRLDSVVNLE